MNEPDTRWDAFRAKLDAAHHWPCDYTLKCIVTPSQVARVRAVLSPHDIALRDSSGGKYQSVTVTFPARDAAHVTGLYQDLAEIEGILLL
jgi:putative lipoic acid-binding regulatory protein